MKHRNTGQVDMVLRKNMRMIAAMMIGLIVLSLIIYFFISGSALDRQIDLMERQKLERTVTAVDYNVDQIAAAGAYFSTVAIHDCNDQFTVEDYYQSLAADRSVQTALAILDALRDVTVQSGDRIFGNRTEFSFDMDGAAHFGTVRDMQVYGEFLGPTADAGATRQLLFVIPESADGYSRHATRLGVDAYALSQVSLHRDNGGGRAEYVVDSRGIVVLSRQNGQIGDKLNDLYGREILRGDLSAGAFPGHVVTVQKTDKLDLYAVSVADRAVYSEYTVQNRVNTALLCGMLLVSGLLVAYTLFRVTYHPIRQLMTYIRHYDVPNGAKTASEVEYINNKFQTLVSANDELSHLAEQKMRDLRTWQVTAMQTQICPHFLYNTLDNLNWIAYRNFKTRDNEVSLAVKKISVLLQSSLDLSEMFRTIEEEVEITKVYVDLLKVRFADAFSIHWHVDEQLADCLILKLCIQPLLENAATHAFTQSDQEGRIDIHIRQEGETILVRVEDNGCGIGAQQLEELRVSINRSAEGNGQHIGMRNVNQRLKVLYGDDSGLTIASELGKGTVCSFHLPMDRDFREKAGE